MTLEQFFDRFPECRDPHVNLYEMIAYGRLAEKLYPTDEIPQCIFAEVSGMAKGHVSRLAKRLAKDGKVLTLALAEELRCKKKKANRRKRAKTETDAQVEAKFAH